MVVMIQELQVSRKNEGFRKDIFNLSKPIHLQSIQLINKLLRYFIIKA